MIILDTNVISALMRPEHNPEIIEWASSRPAAALWLNAVSLMEIRVGLLTMPLGRRRDGLNHGFSVMLSTIFNGRVLPFDQTAAENAARIEVIQRQRGKNTGVGDVQIAGIVAASGATLATRNIKDFNDLDISVVNPWDA